MATDPEHVRLQATALPRKSGQATVADWIRLIQAEYKEIPGLQLTEAQVQRLWGLDPVLCEALLTTLVDVKFLKRSRGVYLRADQD